MSKMMKTLIFMSGALSLLPSQSSFAYESLPEFECLHLNIGLLSLLTTENTNFKRKDKLIYDEQGGIAQGLLILKERGATCAVKQSLYIEAAEYSLHFLKLDNAAIFLERARKLNKEGAKI